MKKQMLTALSLAVLLSLAGCAAADEGAAGKLEQSTEAVYDLFASETQPQGKPNEEYLAAGLSYEKNMWHYQEQLVAALYDQNGGIYTNDTPADQRVYLEIERDRDGKISRVTEVTKEEFQQRIDKI